MADNTSRQRGAVAARFDVAGEAVAWTVSGSTPLGCSYPFTSITYDSINDSSRPVQVSENLETPLDTTPPWTVSGSTPKKSSYSSLALTYDSIGDTSRRRAGMGIYQDAAGEAVPWTVSGTVPPNPNYPFIDLTWDILGDATCLSRTPKEYTMPIPTVSAVIYEYYLRARDSSLPLTDPTRYVYWYSNSATLGSYTGHLPGTGPLVDLVIMSSR
jgi:hypothetical protein